MWGEEVVLSKAIAAVKIDAQRIARASETPDKAQEALNLWTPGVAKERESTGASLESLAKKLNKMSKEKLAELLVIALRVPLHAGAREGRGERVHHHDRLQLRHGATHLHRLAVLPYQHQPLTR